MRITTETVIEMAYHEFDDLVAKHFTNLVRPFEVVLELDIARCGCVSFHIEANNPDRSKMLRESTKAGMAWELANELVNLGILPMGRLIITNP